MVNLYPNFLKVIHEHFLAYVIEAYSTIPQSVLHFVQILAGMTMKKLDRILRLFSIGCKVNEKQSSFYKSWRFGG